MIPGLLPNFLYGCEIKYVTISVYLDYIAVLVMLDLATNDVTCSMSIPQL